MKMYGTTKVVLQIVANQKEASWFRKLRREKILEICKHVAIVDGYQDLWTT